MCRLFVRLSVFCLFLLAAATHAMHGQAVAQEASRPNVLFIAVDDLKPTIGAYGDSLAITPNIDRLARAGTVFMNNHCQQPICGPSRASIMTGLRPDTTRIWHFGPKMRDVRPDTVTIPEHFMGQGYETTSIGKIFDPRNVSGHHDPESWSLPPTEWNDYGWNPEFPRPILGRYQNPTSAKLFRDAKESGLKNHKEILDFLRSKGDNPAVECLEKDQPDNTYTDGAIAVSAVARLRQLAQGKKPFFFGVGFAKPHLPFTAPKKYWDMYKREEMSIDAFQQKTTNPVNQAYHNCGELKSYGDIPQDFNSYSKNHEDHLPRDKQRELIHGYYATTSYVDVQVGKLLDALDDLGISDNTIVVLWGDHGFHLGDHGLWHKHSIFEQATRSPLIVKAPGIEKNIVADSPTEFIDVFPTLCQLAGLPTLPVLEGKSLVPLMKGEAASVKYFAVSQYPRQDLMGYSIRTDRYRYSEWITDWRTDQPYDSKQVQGRELYDYEEDPGETTNFVDDPEYSAVLSDLQGQLHSFFEECRQAAK